MTLEHRYKHVFFDLDGTLMESGPSIFYATRMMMKEFNIPDISDAELRKIVGPPLRIGFRQILGIREEDLDKTIAMYRDVADNDAKHLIHPFDGVREMLCELKNAGLILGVVTSKLEILARPQLEEHGLLEYIDYVAGASKLGVGEKTDLLKRACSECDISRGAVMVGDRFYDLNAANAAKIDSIGVSYGYGEMEELLGCNPTYIVDTVSELRELLLSCSPVKEEQS